MQEEKKMNESGIEIFVARRKRVSESLQKFAKVRKGITKRSQKDSQKDSQKIRKVITKKIAKSLG